MSYVVNSHAKVQTSMSINCLKNQGDILEIKNPTSQDESGVLFQIYHVDPPLRVKGAETELLTWQLNRRSDIHHPVILANAGIQ
jgi:hypothetical protein